MLNRFFIGICIISLLAFAACSDDDVKKGGGDEGREVVVEDFVHEETFAYPAFVGNIDGEFKQAIDEMFTNKVVTPDVGTRLVVLGSINELDASTLKDLYENGTDIAIVHPSKSEIDNFIESNSWVKYFNTENIDKAILVTFNNNSEVHTIFGEAMPFELDNDLDGAYDDDYEDDAGGVDPEYNPSEMDDYVEYKHSEQCCTIAAWISYMNSQYRYSNLDGANDKNDSTNDPFFYGTRISETYTLDTLKKEIRKSGAYREYCTGNPILSLAYNYKMVHVYEGQVGSGDYYIMEMNSSVNNCKMWDGKVRRVDHGGAITQICGWLLERFQVETTLVDEDGKPVNNIQLPTTPEPRTTLHTGKQTYGQSFDIKNEYSISGGYSKEDGPNFEVSANVSLGWSWNSSEEWDIGEVTIAYLDFGNTVGWKADLANFPMWHNGKFVQLSNSLLKGTLDLKGAWIWKEPNTKDNTIGPQYYLKCDVELEYFAISHGYGKTVDTRDYRSNHPKRSYVIKKSITIKIPEVIQRYTAGGVELENDFTSEYIHHINVRNITTNSIVKSINSSYKPGESIDLGYYFNENKYTIEFMANKPSETPRKYIYSLNDSLNITKGQKITLHSVADFTEVD